MFYSGTPSANSSNVGHVVSFEADWTPLSLSFVSSGCYWSLEFSPIWFSRLNDAVMSLADAQVARQYAMPILFGRRFVAPLPHMSVLSVLLYSFRDAHTVRAVAVRCGHLGVPCWKPFVILREITTIRGRQIRYVRQPVRFATCVAVPLFCVLLH
ncbi:hypothetical protein EI94DRAFT_817437 [Lactarius quietus]|nr:hypothetical protein EI94DRAFT_817437 [Lactarius quietus]